MKLLYFKQPKSHKNNGNSIAGFLCRDFLRSNSNCSLSCNYYDSEHYSSNNSISEYVIYVYRKKHFLEKDDYTTFLNMGKHGLYLSYLFSLCKEYTLDSVISQIKGVNVRSFIEKGYFMSSNNLFVRLQGSLLLIENKNIGSDFWGVDEVSSLISYAEAFVREIPSENIDTSKLIKQYNSCQNEDLPDWAKFCIKAGVKIGAAMLAGYIGSQIDIPDIFGDTDSSFDSNLNDFQTNDIFSDFELDTTSIGFNNDFDTDYSDFAPNDGYNVSFGSQHETICSTGGIEKTVTITKEPGSSNLYCITDGQTTIHNVKGGTSTISINNIKYKLPKLKG